MPGVAEAGLDSLRLFDEIDTILIGRTTCEGLGRFLPLESGDYVERMNKTPGIVFAHRGSQVEPIAKFRPEEGGGAVSAQANNEHGSQNRSGGGACGHLRNRPARNTSQKELG